MKIITWKTSQKILKVLAEVSTITHAKQIVKRNKEALKYKGSSTGCPHCCYRVYDYECKGCLWTYAICKVLKINKNKLVKDTGCPCVAVQFVNKKFSNYGQTIPKGISLSSNNISIVSHYIENGYKEWINAHIDWAKNLKNWEHRRVRGYRYDINK